MHLCCRLGSHKLAPKPGGHYPQWTFAGDNFDLDALLGMTTEKHDAPRRPRHSQDRRPSAPSVLSADVEALVDLQRLRGWPEVHDPSLRAPHQLPALAELIQLDEKGPSQNSHRIHGPYVIVGRSHFRHPPVDLSLYGLQDHQLYRLGSPHAQFFVDDERWYLRILAPRSTSALNGDPLLRGDAPRALSTGDEIRLGATTFRFFPLTTRLDEWRHQKQNLLEELQTPALLLERKGAVCGPLHDLDAKTPLVIGRSHPGPNTFPDTSHWPQLDNHFWDLSGVYDQERTFLAFRHAGVEYRNGKWVLCPLSPGYKTFLNAKPIAEAEPLHSGDRIGLGSLILRFRDPAQPHRSPRSSLIPDFVDWSEGRPPAAPPGAAPPGEGD